MPMHLGSKGTISSKMPNWEKNLMVIKRRSRLVFSANQISISRIFEGNAPFFVQLYQSFPTGGSI